MARWRAHPLQCTHLPRRGFTDFSDAGGWRYRLPTARGFAADTWLRCVQNNRIAHTFIVPTMLYALLDHTDTARHDLSSLRALIYGAAPASPSRIRAALNLFGPVLVQTYGQTEAPNTILILDQQAHQRATDRANWHRSRQAFPARERGTGRRR